MKCLHITAGRSLTVEALLAENLWHPLSAIELLESGAVWLGKTRCVAGQSLEHGDTLRVYLRAGQGSPCSLGPEDVVFRDSSLLVVYKKAGIPVQGDPASTRNHLSYAVWTYLGAPKSWHPAPITRLDQPVNGLVLFGTDSRSEKALFSLMREGKIYKWYRTELQGHHQSACCLVDQPLSHSGRFIRVDPGGKSALTLFIPGRVLPQSRIFSAFPLTGRRHQIRVHAASRLGVVVGDTLYGAAKREAPGIALTCIGLNLTLRGRRYRIRLPERFSNPSNERKPSL